MRGLTALLLAAVLTLPLITGLGLSGVFRDPETTRSLNRRRDAETATIEENNRYLRLLHDQDLQHREENHRFWLQAGQQFVDFGIPAMMLIAFILVLGATFRFFIAPGVAVILATKGAGNYPRI